jgi:hypothetical protein
LFIAEKLKNLLPKMEISFSSGITSLLETIHGLNISFEHNAIVDSDKKYMLPWDQQLLLEFCSCLSIVSLMMHLLVYAFLPQLRTIPGKCLMSLSFSLLMVKTTFLIQSHIENSQNSVLCISSALFRLYVFLGE